MYKLFTNDELFEVFISLLCGEDGVDRSAFEKEFMRRAVKINI